MSGKHDAEKQRLYIVLSLDNPLQWETWMILTQAKNKTSDVCEAVCGYNKQKDLEDTLRTVLREELKRIPTSESVESGGGPETAVDETVLDFLQMLQNE